MKNLVKQNWYILLFGLLVVFFGAYCITSNVEFTPEKLLDINLWVTSFIGTYTIGCGLKLLFERVLKLQINDFVLYLITFFTTTIVSGIFTFNSPSISDTKTIILFILNVVAVSIVFVGTLLVSTKNK